MNGGVQTTSESLKRPAPGESENVRAVSAAGVVSADPRRRRSSVVAPAMMAPIAPVAPVVQVGNMGTGAATAPMIDRSRDPRRRN